MIAFVPLVVPLLLASRHIVPYTRSSCAAVYDHCWLVAPLQSYSCTCVPPGCELLGTSTQRPEPPPTIRPADPVGELLGEAEAEAEGDEDCDVVGEADGEELLPNCAKKFHTTCLVHVCAPVPLPLVDPSTGAGVWPESNAAHTTGYPGLQPE